MITEHDLQEAIAECQGRRNPDAKTCMMLAAFYTIRREMFGNPEQVKEPDEPLRLIPGSSFAPPPENVETTVEYESDTEFGQMIHGRPASEIWPIIDELVTEPIQALNPRLYDALFRKLKK